ncbi:hypothetical protein [Micromonospora sp. NPDC049204]|uniref:hypothetical protein n=1 Tax=Micromonospora sp. NPDC049204 TaxID=3154351 RepID=UPI0033D78CAE
MGSPQRWQGGVLRAMSARCRSRVAVLRPGRSLPPPGMRKARTVAGLRFALRAVFARDVSV